MVYWKTVTEEGLDMADDVEELVKKHKELQAELQSWKNKAAVAKADEARIKKELSALLKELKEEFGCSTYEEAVELRDTKLKEYALQVEELEGKLNALGSL